MDFHSLIERKRERFQQLESDIADPHLFDNRKRASETMREHAAIKDLLAKGDELQIARQVLPKAVRQHLTEAPVREPSSDVEPFAVPPIAVVQQGLQRISPGELR